MGARVLIIPGRADRGIQVCGHAVVALRTCTGLKCTYHSGKAKGPVNCSEAVCEFGWVGWCRCLYTFRLRLCVGVHGCPGRQ
jgi:hypothetical protein